MSPPPGRLKSGSLPLGGKERGDNSGPMHEQHRVVGQRLPRIDAGGKVTGRQVYATDFSQPGMLFGKVLRSPVAHARIVRIDAAKARMLPGVRAILTGADVPAIRYGQPGSYCVHFSRPP